MVEMGGIDGSLVKRRGQGGSGWELNGELFFDEHFLYSIAIICTYFDVLFYKVRSILLRCLYVCMYVCV